MNTALASKLRKFGLTKSEVSIYLYLLENGISTPPQIAKGTGIARTNTYNVLRKLKEKDLIDSQPQRKRKAYIASDPNSLIRSLERKQEIVKQFIPDLRGLYTTQKNKPKIKFYDGFEQVKQIYWQTLEAKEVFAIASTEILLSIESEFFVKFRRELKKKNIVFTDVLDASSQNKSAPSIKEELKGLYHPRFLSPKYGDLPVDILIWNDNVAIISLEKPYFGTVLTNKTVADSFRIIFRVMYDSLAG